jgi:hypothetical protein
MGLTRLKMNFTGWTHVFDPVKIQMENTVPMSELLNLMKVNVSLV